MSTADRLAPPADYATLARVLTSWRNGNKRDALAHLSRLPPDARHAFTAGVGVYDAGTALTILMDADPPAEAPPTPGPAALLGIITRLDDALATLARLMPDARPPRDAGMVEMTNGDRARMEDQHNEIALAAASLTAYAAANRTAHPPDRDTLRAGAERLASVLAHDQEGDDVTAQAILDHLAAGYDLLAILGDFGLLDD